jgi:hypothetical protein
MPLAVQGPDAVKLTGSWDEEVALGVKELPYCTFGSGAKLMVCDWVVEPCGRTMKVSETELAALKAVVPGCDAVMVQLPIIRVSVADETLFAIDWLAIVQDPLAVKRTWSPLGAPFAMEVAVTVGGLVMITELGNGPRTMVWLFLSTAGVEGTL